MSATRIQEGAKRRTVVKDEEIDDILKKAGASSGDLKPDVLERIADSIKPSLRPVRPLPPTWAMSGRTGPGLRGRLSGGRGPRRIFRI